MSRSAIIIIAALFIILVPFLGFPRSWEPTLFFMAGGIILVLELSSVLSRAQDAFFHEYEITTDVYAERIQEKVVPRRSNRTAPIDGADAVDLEGDSVADTELPFEEREE